LLDDLYLVIGENQAQVKLISMSSPDQYPSRILSHARARSRVEVIPPSVASFMVGVYVMRTAAAKTLDDPEKLALLKLLRGEFHLFSKDAVIPLETVFAFSPAADAAREDVAQTASEPPLEPVDSVPGDSASSTAGSE
jgi:hypothetical protein